jgi:hypothetical protein
MSRPCFDSHLFVLLFFWFSCAFSCSSEPAIRQTGTDSASIFGMTAITNHDLRFCISAKNVLHSDSIKLANEVSIFINRRSLKIVMLNETLSPNALDFHFLVRMSTSGSSARKTLLGYLYNALSKNSQTLLSLDVMKCNSEQTNRLDISECTRIEWKFCSSSSPVVTVLSSEAKSIVTEQLNPNGENWAAAEAVFSCGGAAAKVSLGRLSELEASSITAAGVYPRPFMVAETNLANLRLCRKSESEHQHR